MRTTGRSITAALVLLSATLGFAGCGGGSAKSGGPVDTLAPPVVAKATKVTVDAIDNDFRAKHLQVAAGTKVTFANVGRNPHDVVVDDPDAFDFGITPGEFQPGDAKSFTFDKPGTYPYYCSIHATATAGPMRGVITVTG